MRSWTRGWVWFAGLLALAVGLGCGNGWGQAMPGSPEAGTVKTSVVEPMTPLLPDHFLTWTTSSLAAAEGRSAKSADFAEATCAPTLPADTSADGDGARCLKLLSEDGLMRFSKVRYGNGGSGLLDAFAEQFGDATGAYSAYTFYRMGMHGARALSGGARVGNEAVADADGTLVLAGTSVLRLQRRGGTGRGSTGHELETLVAGLPKVSGRKALAPLLPRYLPPQGLDGTSVRYALGPVGYEAMGGVLPGGVMSWDKSAEAATARYRGRGGEGTLTLLLYPTPQIAGERGRAIEKAVNDRSAGSPQSLGMVKMRRVGPLVGMTTGGFSAGQAQALMAGLHLSEEVTFDQKMPLEFHAEVKKTASLLENIAVLCGVLILAAVLLGVFLGGARAGIRVLRGKPAASEPEFLTINLRDQPRALFSGKSEEDRLQG